MIEREISGIVMEMAGYYPVVTVMGPRLSAEALEATVKRLDSAIKHAEKLFNEGKVYGDAQWREPKVLSGLSERKTKEEIVQSDGRKVEVDGSKGQFVSEYFRTSCPSYYKRDYYDRLFV